MLGPECCGNPGSANRPDTPAGIRIWIVVAGAGWVATRAPIGLKIRSGELVEKGGALRLRNKGILQNTQRAYITIKRWRAATGVAGDPNVLLVVPVSLANGLAGSLAGHG